MNEKSAKPRCTVLIVEDEPFVRLFGAGLLEEAGFDVLQARDAGEALRLLETHAGVRAVFSDVDMPGSLDGLGLARCIRQRWPHIGIVLTSGHRVTAGMIPAEGKFLPKPYDGKALARHMKEVMH